MVMMGDELNWPESIGFAASYLSSAWRLYNTGDDSGMNIWFDDLLCDMAVLAVQANISLEGENVDNLTVWRRAAEVLEANAEILRNISEKDY